MYFNLFYKNLNNRVLPNSEFPNYQMSKVQIHGNCLIDIFAVVFG